MEQLGAIFHHGLIVKNLAEAMAGMTRTAGTAWCAVRQFDPLPVWTPDGGRGEVRLKVAYSRPGPMRLELIETLPDTPYDRLREVGQAHVGVWVDSVGDGVERLCAEGWRLLLAGASPRHRYGSMAYLAREGAPVIELVGNELREMMAAWWDSADA